MAPDLINNRSLCFIRRKFIVSWRYQTC